MCEYMFSFKLEGSFCSIKRIDFAVWEQCAKYFFQGLKTAEHVSFLRISAKRAFVLILPGYLFVVRDLF